MLPVGSVIGIIGGGQLGRMMAAEVSKLGYFAHIYTPEVNSPASELAKFTTVAAYNDIENLKKFVNLVDIITFEFENIPYNILKSLEGIIPIYPSPEILRIAQNRIVEKNFLHSINIKTTPFYSVKSVEDLKFALNKINNRLGTSSILKTCEMGYDGKGQVKIASNNIDNPENIVKIWRKFTGKKCILEGFVFFEREISVIIARRKNGEIAIYPPTHNIHQNHILDKSIYPCGLSDNMQNEAKNIAKNIANSLELVGLLGVEMFYINDANGEELIVNEIAPRPHNSGHWTMNGAVTSQFEQVIRAICNLPLGDVSAIFPKVIMQNLIGDYVKIYQQALSQKNAKIHLYGKKEVREGRKMGHINYLD